MDLGIVLAAAASALREQLPTKSPLDSVSMTEGRVDVLMSRGLQRMANGCGDPVVAAMYEKARPMVDKVLLETVGPKKVRR